MRCFGWLVTLLHISSKTADDVVENNDQEILSGLESETFECLNSAIRVQISEEFDILKTSATTFFENLEKNTIN